MPTNSTTRTAIAPPLAASSNMTGIRDAERNSNRNVSSCSTYLHSAIANWDDGQFSTFEHDNDHFSSFADNDRFTLIFNERSSSSSSEQHISSEVASIADIESENNNPNMCRIYEKLPLLLHLGSPSSRVVCEEASLRSLPSPRLQGDDRVCHPFPSTMSSAPFCLRGWGRNSWTTRWITDKHLSPEMIESKVYPSKIREASWSSVWGMEHLSPRTIVKRKWKSGKVLVGTAAEILGKQVKKMVPAKKVLKIVAVEKGASRRKIIQEANEKFVPVQLTITAKQKTVPMQRILATQKTAPVQNNPASTQKTMPTQNLALVQQKSLVTISKKPTSTMPPATSIIQKKKKPTSTSTIPTAFFSSVLSNSNFHQVDHFLRPFLLPFHSPCKRFNIKEVGQPTVRDAAGEMGRVAAPSLLVASSA
ncbi:unnamed protein product [Zymoseptoria tritici ST99CH_1E4]|uniref:Uncharacterized protein n=1 Tax=Zymoseptoria tritici ST99CH_1E4 TaxID=1276532 RepID=A0A2H1H9W0_ZYMTR|nr:unnamed protein product [Zymoseptoria tritici ST99CH_1E4]